MEAAQEASMMSTLLTQRADNGQNLAFKMMETAAFHHSTGRPEAVEESACMTADAMCSKFGGQILNATADVHGVSPLSFAAKVRSRAAS